MRCSRTRCSRTRRPVKLDLLMARYLIRQTETQRKHFPFATMIEPLEACNLCTNSLLLREKLDLFRPSPYLSFVVHLDSTEKAHNAVTKHEGAYSKALACRLRVTTNSTLFHSTDVADLRTLSHPLDLLALVRAERKR